MADNVQITAGSGTTVAADDVGGVLYPRAKLSLGADGAATDALGGAGAVAAGVQRVTLASDDPAVSALTTSNTNTGNSATSLAIIDDWDESDRAKVNLIVGQAGVAAGAGAVGATVPRVTLASDDPAVTSLAVMDDWDESDRCKVNIIAGQAGVAAGSGANGATVPRVTIATDDQTAANINNALVGEYETVAASQTAQVLGATGGTGDWLAGVLIVPATTSPGNVIILDNATSITIFTGGASSVSNLVPFMVPLGMKSVSGAWKITTGANVSCIGIGNFT